MNEFRERWPDRRGFILSVIGVSMGLSVLHHAPVAASGVHLLIWLVAMFTLILPTLVLELAMGMIFQGSLSESLRKSDKRLEVMGWFAGGVAFCALVLAGGTVGNLCMSGYDCLLATLADQPLPWAPQLGEGQQSRLVLAASPVALAVVMAIIDLRLWRGARSIARTAVVAVPCGLLLLLVVIAALALHPDQAEGLSQGSWRLAFHPGAVDGLTRWLTPDALGWRVLLDWQVWTTTYGYALSTWLLGLGIYAAFGSYLNRSSDITGLAGVSVFGAALGQMLLMAVVAVATGLAWDAVPLATHTQDVTSSTVPSAIANLGMPVWARGALATLWFVALLAFALPALLALAEAVVAPIVDKFRIARERVVAAVCMAAFFCAALADASHGPMELITGNATILICTAVLVGVMTSATWKWSDLDALQRHLNAYSAIRVGRTWRLLVRWLVPVIALQLAVAGERLLHQAAGDAGNGGTLGSVTSAQIAVGALALLWATAFVLSRLPARST